MKFSEYYQYIVENTDMDAEGKRLAKKYDLIYNGWWKDPVNMFTFTDKVTKSTFVSVDEPSTKKRMEEVRSEHEAMANKTLDVD